MGWFYRQVARRLLFSLDAERAHDLVLGLGRAGDWAPAAAAIRACHGFEDRRLGVEVFGLKFENPFGVAAGLDKNGSAIGLFAALGFGHVEIGTVTARPQEGNPRPRIFRLPADQAIINRMGFPSAGADAVAERLRTARRPKGLVLGINLGKNKNTPLEKAAEDYLYAFERLRDLGDYFVLNVSSPNTPELRRLQEPARLMELFAAIGERNDHRKPILVKISPDLSERELDELLRVCTDAAISGIIATNTTLSRPGLSDGSLETGGLSGQPLFDLALGMVRRIRQSTAGKLPIIGAGGISTAQQAGAMMESGASLVQIYTGLIYQGPAMASQLKKELCRWLDSTPADRQVAP